MKSIYLLVQENNDLSPINPAIVKSLKKQTLVGDYNFLIQRYFPKNEEPVKVAVLLLPEYPKSKQQLVDAIYGTIGECDIKDFLEINSPITTNTIRSHHNAEGQAEWANKSFYTG